MSHLPKFSVFRRHSRSKHANGDRPRLFFSPNGDVEEAWKTNVKLAWIFGVGALLLVFADSFGRVKNGTDTNLMPEGTANINLKLTPPERSKERAGFSLQFRLSNNGKQPVFYPLSRTTNTRIGQLVARASSSSEWRRVSGTLGPPVLAEQELRNPSLAWMEMPPGGWVDGEFRDPGDSLGEQAYMIYLKTARDGRGMAMASRPYSLPAD